LVLVLIAGFCAFGFAASSEPGYGWGWKFGYGVIGALCLVGAVALISSLRREKPPDNQPS
jgi:hypothetical protein